MGVCVRNTELFVYTLVYEELSIGNGKKDYKGKAIRIITYCLAAVCFHIYAVYCKQYGQLCVYVFMRAAVSCF